MYTLFDHVGRVHGVLDLVLFRFVGEDGKTKSRQLKSNSRPERRVNVMGTDFGRNDKKKQKQKKFYNYMDQLKEEKTKQGQKTLSVTFT